MDVEIAANVMLSRCHLCSSPLLPHPIFEKSGTKYCPKDGDFFVQHLRGEKPLIIFRPYPEDDRPFLDEEKTHPIPIALPSLAKKNSVGHPGRRVQCEQTGAIFPSVCKTAEALGLQKSRLSLQLSGAIRAINGYTFRYIDKPSDISTECKPFVDMARGFLVRCDQTGKTFSSQREAARVMGLDRELLRKHMVGKFVDVNGYTFTQLPRD